MLKRFTTILILGVIVGVSAAAYAHERGWPGKRLAQTLPEAETFALKETALTGAQVAWLEKNLGESVRTEDRRPRFYVGAAKGGAPAGSVVFLDATGTNGKVEMGLAIAPSGEILRVILFEHSEPGALASKAFLRQFTGKKAADHFRVGHDVEAPPKHKKGAQILATTVRRGLLLAMAGLRLGVE